MQLTTKDTLFQQTAKRVVECDGLKFNPHIIITNSDFRFIVDNQLKAIGIKPRRILIEPEAKNTAPAILAATIFAQKDDKMQSLLQCQLTMLLVIPKKFS